MGARREVGSVPFGHMGGDGWSLTYYYAWASSADIPTTIWNDVTVPILDTFDTFDRAPDGGAAGGGADSAPPNHCCFGLNIPSSAWGASLLPVVAQVGDTAWFNRLCDWLTRHFRAETRDALGRPLVRVAESVEWEIGNTANYLLGVSVAAGSSLRRIVQAPPARSYFDGPLLLEASAVSDAAGAHPARCAVDVFRCWRPEPAALNVGVVVFGAATTLRLELANVAAVGAVTYNGRKRASAAFAKGKRGGVLSVPVDEADVGSRIELTVACR
jgi:hypothetical protein